MKQTHDIEKDTSQTNDAISQEQAGYPDISRVNTKIVVIISFICILLIFFLSIFVPVPSTDADTSKQSGTMESSTEVTTEMPDSEETSQGLFDMGNTQTSVTTEVFSMQIFSEPRTGFASIDGNTYYFNNVTEKNI